MVTKAIARYVRISPRKTRKVVDLVRGLPAPKAEAILDTLEKRPTLYIKRLLLSALDSADKRFHASPADLYISLIKVDQGPMLKRYRAASMGRATMIKHRTSHITLELDRIKRPEKRVDKGEGTRDKGAGKKTKGQLKKEPKAIKTEVKKPSTRSKKTK